MAVMIGMIMTASTMATVNTVLPVPETGGAKRGNHPRLSVSQTYNGVMAGASTLMPQSPKTTDGTAASRSIT